MRPLDQPPARCSGRGRAPWQVPLVVDRHLPESLTGQLVSAVRTAVHDGSFPTASRLPSTRALAADLGISRTVTAEAYARLIAEGYLETRHGSGTFVADLTLPGPPPQRGHVAVTVASAAPSLDLRTGTTAPDPSGPAGWGRAVRVAARDSLPNSYQDARGSAELRAAVAAYLGRSRGLTCSAEDVVVTSGSTQSLDLLLRAAAPAESVVAHESPGHPGVAALIRHHRLTPVAIPVDGDGLRVDLLRRAAPAPGMVHVTPSHQYPLGMRMNVGRRAELTGWARDHDAVVIEDDYDSEFRFDGPPLPTLASLDRGCVVYLGTLSKVLSPAVRCGFLVARADLVDEITRVKNLVDGPLSWPLQRTVVELLTSRTLDRHVRRVRHRYARARTRLLDGLIDVHRLVEVTGAETGLHVTLRLVRGHGAAELVTRAQRRGVALARVSGPPGDQGDRGDRDDTVVIAYGGLTDDQLGAAARELAGLIRASVSR